MLECIKREVPELTISEAQRQGVNVNEIAKSVQEGVQKFSVRSFIL